MLRQIFNSGRLLHIASLASALLFVSIPCNAETYTYDPAGRLTSVTYDDGSSLTYVFDNNGNRLGLTAVGPDTDGDGVEDAEDAFPDDPEEWLDTDEDGTGNNADTDDDDDGVPDESDAFPLDAGESQDSDNDGIGDNSDNCPDTENSEQTDSDEDGTGDKCEVTNDDSLIDLLPIFKKILDNEAAGE